MGGLTSLADVGSGGWVQKQNADVINEQLNQPWTGWSGGKISGPSVLINNLIFKKQ